MYWTQVSLPADKVAAGMVDQFQNHFFSLMITAGAPDLAAIFQCRQGDGSQSLFLTPQAGLLAGDALLGVTLRVCERPESEGLALLVGDIGAWALLNN